MAKEENGPETDRSGAVETAPLQPPLSDVLPPGEEGARAFERLMHAVLEAWAQRDGFHYGRGMGEGGPTIGDAGLAAYGFALVGVPGLDGGVAFAFEHPATDAEGSAVASILKSSPTSGWRKIESDEEAGPIRHLVIFHAGATAPAPDTSSLNIPPKIQLHIWGPDKIEPLLRACPALLARYYPAEAESMIRGYDGFPYPEFEKAIRKAVVTAHAPLRMLGLPTDVLGDRDRQAQVALTDVFVPLRLLHRDDPNRAETAAEVLAKGASCVVLGDPGSGKTTLLLYLALVHAGGATLEGCPPTCRLPLYVPLRELVKAQVVRPGLTIVDYLAERARERDQIQRAHPALFEAALRLGEAIVFFDGLDEVGSDASRRKVVEQVRAFQGAYPTTPLWVTSRKYGYTAKVALPGETFQHRQVAGLNQDEANQLIERWYAAREPVPGERIKLTKQLQEAIARTPGVRRLSQNPLLLTLMALIHQTQKKLPRDRGELYGQCAEMLLKTWHDAKREENDPLAPEVARLRLPAHTQKDYLAHLAIHVQQKNQGEKNDETRGLIDRAEALEVLAKRHLEVALRARPELELGVAREEMNDFLGYIADRTGLLIDRGGGVLSFIHLSFQEYLAAWVYLCGGAPTPAFFEERMGQQAWEEVLLLRLYVISTTPGGGGSAAFDAIVSQVLRGQEKQDRPQVWLTLARALRDNLEFRKVDRRAILERALVEWLKQPAFAGEWFDVLLEITLFTEGLLTDLREIVIDAVGRRPPAESVACLHLATRLFGFPGEAVKALEVRLDLDKMRADLCAFWSWSEAAPLLANASAADWTAMLEAVDSPDTYRAVVEWMNEEKPPAALKGAAAFLGRKVLLDSASRTAFAAKHRDHAMAGNLFTTGETLRIQGWHYDVEAPYNALRVAKSPGPAPGRTAKLFCPVLAAAVAQNANPPEESVLDRALARRAAGALAAMLATFPTQVPIDPTTLDALGKVFGCDFGCDFGRDFGRAFVRDFGRAFGRAFVRDFGRAFGRDFVRDFGIDSEAPDFDTQWDQAMAKEGYLLRVLADPHLWEHILYFSRARNVGFAPVRGARDAAVGEAGSASPAFHLTNPFAAPAALVEVWKAAGVVWVSQLSRDLSVKFPAGNFEKSDIHAWIDHNPIGAFSGALAWGYHAEILLEKGLSLQGERGALILAHAAYCACRSGFLGKSDAWQKLFAERDTADPRIEAAYLLLQMASFENIDASVSAWRKLVQNPPDKLRPLFEAARIIAPSSAGPSSLQTPTPKETPVMPAWFEVASFPWSDPRAEELLQLLYNAYSDIDRIRFIGQKAGIHIGHWVSERGAEPAWRSLIDLAASQGKARRLLDQVLGDKGVVAFHADLKNLMKGNAPATSAPAVPAPAASSSTLGNSFAAQPAGSPATRAADAGPTFAMPASSLPSPAPAPKPPSERVLFSWIHLSDIHIGHGDRSHQLNQKRILDALARDIEEVRERGECPAPNALFVTGDIAFSGKEEQYTEAKTWLTRVANSVHLNLAHVFVVPGNHDVDRSADKDKSTSRTVSSVRAGHETLDDVLHDAPSRALLAKRMAAYTTFATDFGPNDAPSDRLYWTHSWIVESGIKVRLIGLNTALLAAGNDDKSRLSLGEAQLQLLTSSKEELTFLLTHHPLHWLSDRTTAEPQAKQHVDIHLSGHVHEAESMSQWGGAGTGILRVVAGAAHNEAQPAGVPAAHGYNWGAVVQTPDNNVVARVWPWRWVNTQDFRLDVQNVPKGKTFAEHELLRLRLNVMLPKAMGLRSSEKQRPR